MVERLPCLSYRHDLGGQFSELNHRDAAMDGCRPAGTAAMAGQGAGVGGKATEYWQELAADSAKLMTATKPPH